MRQQFGESVKKTETQAEQKKENQFNSITNKTKVENQNQTHNSKKEGLGPMNRYGNV